VSAPSAEGTLNNKKINKINKKMHAASERSNIIINAIPIATKIQAATIKASLHSKVTRSLDDAVA